MNVLHSARFIYGNLIFVWLVCFFTILSLLFPWFFPKDEEFSSYKSLRRLRWALFIGWVLAADTATLSWDPYVWWGMLLAFVMGVWFPGFYIKYANELELSTAGPEDGP